MSTALKPRVPAVYWTITSASVLALRIIKANGSNLVDDYLHVKVGWKVRTPMAWLWYFLPPDVYRGFIKAGFLTRRKDHDHEYQVLEQQRSKIVNEWIQRHSEFMLRN